ncbi:TPA: hypothetical protein ACH3X1_015580 [Trebouxia sp. C0004]
MLCSVCSFCVSQRGTSTRSVFPCMRDLTTAFDSVDRSMARHILLSRGVLHKLVTLRTFTPTTQPLSEQHWTHTHNRFTQGCVFAQHKFVLLPQPGQVQVTISYRMIGQLRPCCEEPALEIGD